MAQRVGTVSGTIAGELGATVKFSPSLRVYALGAILLVALTISSRKLGSPGELAFIFPLSIAGIAYLFAIREFFSTPEFPRRVVVICLVLAACGTFRFSCSRRDQTMTFTGIFGTAAYNGLDITLLMLFPAIPRSLHCTLPRLAR